jgi:hypothetical protein
MIVVVFSLSNVHTQVSIMCCCSKIGVAKLISFCVQGENGGTYNNPIANVKGLINSLLIIRFI